MAFFPPDRYVSSVEQIDIEALYRQGKRALLLDRDNTLVPRDRRCAPDSVMAWLSAARRLGFQMMIVSNNWHRDHVARSASELHMDYISHAMKPAPFALSSALRRLQVDPDQAVMIGDQLYTDVWAGKLAGIHTILVQPQTTTDLWFTRIMRIFERRALMGVPLEE
ncbi:YqeG family HAD IIIA-type phosphatase [Collinsella sp. AGMB00827]|uniref:YqeG family HAD IIIA-type phosphatase n=1 Tax=Collinsella ureilytica TaxID=2869515 RepID=A0ABS7ML56_9ACTN|nr:YqeG family HAD IIIA-type phosphatase [Collinsella urealyticum]MBY4798094.1 YqeG family HAD IIIA-type phosphatase [Collinsella urealyticum]